jgi:hypothetical protein
LFPCRSGPSAATIALVQDLEMAALIEAEGLVRPDRSNN